MPTTPEKLQATLDDLHSELDAIDQLDEATREQLRTTIVEIQAALGRRTARDQGASTPRPTISRLPSGSMTRRADWRARTRSWPRIWVA